MVATLTPCSAINTPRGVHQFLSASAALDGGRLSRTAFRLLLVYEVHREVFPGICAR